MESKNNTVWILKGNDSFAVFSLKEYAEEYKTSLIELWKKSIIRDSIPRSLNELSEIEKYADEYIDVIQVENDRYSLIKGWSNGRNGSKEWRRYNLMSNKDWTDYYEEFISRFIIEEWAIVK